MNNPNPNHPFTFGNANQNPPATSSNSNNNLSHFQQQPNQIHSNTNLMQTSISDSSSFQKRAHKRKPITDPNLQIQIDVPNLQENNVNLHQQGNQVKGRSFDNFGNYSFGIREHIDIPGVKYDPKIGIMGLGISVTLTRPGYGIRTRSKHKASVGKKHIISADEAKDYLVKEFGVTVV